MKSQLLKLKICVVVCDMIFFIGCTEQDKSVVQKLYYPNGKIHVEQTVKNGRLHGQYISYYYNGKIESRYQYVNGKLHGNAFIYYNNGLIKGRLKMLNDSLDGPTQLYYRNGTKKETGFYRKGKSIGTFILFDSITGKPVERHKFTNDGRLYFVDGYDSNGNPFNQGFIPLINAKSSISLGEFYKGRLSFGRLLPGEITMIIGRAVALKNKPQLYQIVDTFSVIRPDSNGVFHFSYSPRQVKIGKNVMHYVFRHKSPHHDSLSVDGLSGIEPFWVIKPNAAK